MENFVEQISIKFRGFYFNQDEFGSNCPVDKHTKISVKICISADIQKVKYRPIISVGLKFIPFVRSIIRSLPCSNPERSKVKEIFNN